MFNKAQFFIGIAISCLLGFSAGYSKAREVCMEAIAKSVAESEL